MKENFSLIDFVDSTGEALFYQKDIPVSQAKVIPQVIALQGKPGSYSGMFALSSADKEKEFRLFTGEAIKSNAAKMHILGEETCRILRLLGLSDPEAAAAYNQAIGNMSVRIHEADINTATQTGIYCCGTCSCAFWRNLAAGSFDHQEERLVHGLQELTKCRIGGGKWRRFPFYYTLLTLNEINLPAAKAEIAYALPTIEKLLRRHNTKSSFEKRRIDLLERIINSM